MARLNAACHFALLLQNAGIDAEEIERIGCRSIYGVDMKVGDEFNASPNILLEILREVV